jgi:hypothetical protein
MKGRVTGSEPQATIAWSKLTAPVGRLYLELAGRHEASLAIHDDDLALASQAGQTAREALDYAILPAAQTLDVDLDLAERQTADLAHLACFRQYFGGVQQCLRGDAADIQTDAAQCRPPIDQDDFLAQIGGAKRGRVATRSSSENEHLGVHRTRRHRTSRRTSSRTWHS